MRQQKIQTYVRKSCLTGKVVWIYRGLSKAAERMAYWRACKKEVERVRRWAERTARRRRNIFRLLSDSSSSSSITDELTDEQREAARWLSHHGKRNAECNREFYEHIMEERRLRNKKQNRNYDK